MSVSRFVPRGVAGWSLLTAWVGVACLAWTRPVSLADFADPGQLEAVGFRLPINTAGADELVALHGIGPALAQRMVAHREAHGPFADAAALQDVSGIGDLTAARIVPWLEFD